MPVMTVLIVQGTRGFIRHVRRVLDNDLNVLGNLKIIYCSKHINCSLHLLSLLCVIIYLDMKERIIEHN